VIVSNIEIERETDRRRPAEVVELLSISPDAA